MKKKNANNILKTKRRKKKRCFNLNFGGRFLIIENLKKSGDKFENLNSFRISISKLS